MQRLSSMVMMSMFFVFVHVLSVQADENRTATHDAAYYYRSAVAHCLEKKFTTAKEDCAKVLYVERYYSRASFLLGRMYEGERSFTRALREYRYTASAAGRDPSLGTTNRLRMAEAAADSITRVRSLKRIGCERVSMSDCVLILLAALILIGVVLVVSIRSVQRMYTARRLQRECRLWVDRYWERQCDQDIRGEMPSMVCWIGLIIIAVICAGAFRAVIVYGFPACWTALVHIFLNICGADF